MQQQVLEKLSQLGRRYRRVVAWDVFLEIAFILTAGVGALLLVDRLAFEFGIAKLHASTASQILTAFGSALVLAAIAAPMAAIARNVPKAGIAWRADKMLAADERLLTSMEMPEANSPFAPMIYAEAAEALRQADPRRIVPWIPVGYRYGIVLAIAAGALLAAFPPQVYPAPVAGLLVLPTRGVAPLKVVCEDLSQGRITERTWEFGDGTKADRVWRVEHTFTKPGKYPIRVKVRGPGGSDTATFDAIVEVLATNDPFADFLAEPRKGRMPLDVHFKNVSKNADHFRWDFGDGSTSTEPEPTHTYEKPGLFTVILEAKLGEKLDRVERKAHIKVVSADAPLADFRAWPRKGEAPLLVNFENNTTGNATAWEWDFGDRLGGKDRFSTERNPAYEYRAPGRYTVRLKAIGPGGEDVKVRERYIEVTSDGDGSGSGGGGGLGDSGKGGGGDTQGTPGGGSEPGRLFGDPAERHPAEFKPGTVEGQPKGDNLVEKVKNVYTGEETPGVKSPEKPYKQVFGDYRRAAEDAMKRDQIPPGLRDYVKKYFDQIRPK